MNILIIGSSGRVGQLLTEQLLQENHQVVGTSRQDKKRFNHKNYQQIKLDISKPYAELAADFPKDIEAVYYVSGSGGKDLLRVDLHGAVKTMQLTEHHNISRYIMLSAYGSLTPALWYKKPYSNLMEYYMAKHYADRYLIHNTTLDYTILQPGLLTEEPGSGRVELHAKEGGANSLSNVAKMLAKILTAPNTFRKTIPMRDGKTPIKEAVETL